MTLRHDRIDAPMAGTVVEVYVVAGQSVRAEQALLVLEAMKMEHELRAPVDAQVEGVMASVGERVAAGDLLMRLGASVEPRPLPAPEGVPGPPGAE